MVGDTKEWNGRGPYKKIREELYLEKKTYMVTRKSAWGRINSEGKNGNYCITRKIRNSLLKKRKKKTGYVKKKKDSLEYAKNLCKGVKRVII